MWPSEKDVSEFLDVAQKLDVRVIYLSAETITPDTLLEMVASMLDDSTVAFQHETAEGYFEGAGILSDKRVGQYLSHGKERYGRKSTIRVEWVHGGVVHRYLAVANWLGKLIDNASEIADLLEPPGDQP
jgi:hypothetical protein